MKGKTFVGFGLGPTQLALFLSEAQRNGDFERYVVSEIDDRLVSAVRDSRGKCTINIADRRTITPRELSGIEVLDPCRPLDRQRLVDAISDADELATALPTVAAYETGGPAAVAGLLADGLRARASDRPCLIYAAENSSRAAEILTEALRRRGAAPDSFDVLSTVIGKMCGVIDDPLQVRRLGLRPLAGSESRAVLVEAFDRLQVARPAAARPTLGAERFEWKDDLRPFQEAKICGHNAIHALLGYLAERRGYGSMAQAGRDERLMAFVRDAFLEESRPAMLHRHAGTGDPLFTPPGYAAYAEDLLERMTNPNLNDQVRRVTRDHRRKLGPDDRIFGTMRYALAAGVRPRRLALGAAAAVLSFLDRRDELPSPDGRPSPPLPRSGEELDDVALGAWLHELWAPAQVPQADELVRMTWSGIQRLSRSSDRTGRRTIIGTRAISS
jgi:mannitol-1-phosphate 5-dehydrogenase